MRTILQFFLLAGSAMAAITGTVRDQSGAAIPNAPVVLHNVASSAETLVRSDAQGAFSFPADGPGEYELRVNMPGFEPFRGNAASADIVLKIATRNDAIVVTDASADIEPSATEFGGKFSARKLESLPVNGRSFTDLLTIQPGVAPANVQQPGAVVMSGCTSTPPSGDLNPGNLSVSGQRETANGFQINGASAQEDFNMGASIVPNLDAIADVQVLTGGLAAEYGNFSGGQVLVSTKSGANQLHGSLFDFVRNTSFDARNYFAADRAVYRRNQPGATIGGPLRRDRVFFFADYQDTRLTQGVDTGLIAVPTTAERTGDFSARSSVLAGTVNGDYWAKLLTSRLGYAVTPGEPYSQVFPDAKIPSRAWSAPSQALLKYIPLPNAGESTFSTSSENQTLRDDKGAIRIDAQTRAGQLYGYYFADDYRLDNPYPTSQGGASVPGFNAISMGRSQLTAIGLTTAFGASRVNEFRASYTRSANNIGQPVGGVGPSLASQGFSNIVPLAPAIEGIENVALNDFTFGVDTTGARQVNNTYLLSDNFSLTFGRHLVKLGASLHLDQVNINPDAIYNGSFLFQGTETGSDFADFLLGIASNYAQGDSRPFYLRNHYLGLYAQDRWQIRPGLTLNYGLRWDLLPPWSEKYNQLQTLVPGMQSRVYANAPEGLVFPGDPGIPSTLAPARHDNFAPRAGLAWSPGSGKTTVRAGFGLYYTAIEGLSAGIMSANPPYGYDYNSLAPPLFNNPFINAADGYNVGQRFPEPIPSAGQAVNWSTYLPITGVPSFYYRNRTPYTENYSFRIEREITPSTTLSAGYVGSQAHHLLVLISANPGNPAECLALGSDVCGPFRENITRSSFSPDFAAVTYQKTIGNSNYNSLEVTVRNSTPSRDLSLAYTYGKSIDQSSGLPEAVNPVNPSLSRAVSAFDLRQNVVATYSYKLKGWTLSGVARFTSGLPVTLYNNTDTSLLGTIPNGINNNGVDTPDYTPGSLALNRNPRNGEPAFNTALFSLPALGSIGTASRRMFAGPGMENFDVALSREIRFKDSGALQLRVELFNAFNHAQFYGAAAVNGNITSSSFGQIVSAQAPRQIQLAARYTF